MNNNSNQRINPSDIARIQHNPENVRNFCILAHVDHGKTTLADSLVSYNGIISAKLAGKLRFLDSTEEEQKRGITMHSSAISILFEMESSQGSLTTDESSNNRNVKLGENMHKSTAKDEFLINLVDSPGHIDFSSDVSTATRLCDGALIVIDVIEGVCTQTHAVLYKALKERMRPCLVLNKIDRLMLEMKQSTTEAFHHLRRLVENVNALAFTLLNSEIIKNAEENNIDMTNVDIKDDPRFEEWSFSPEKGNVVFTGALDCWGFGIMKFVNLWHKRLGLNKNILKKYLFDDYSINLDTKKLVKCDQSEGIPMFATLVLDLIWEMYDLSVLQHNPQSAAKIALEQLGVQLPPREISTRDPRSTVQSIMRRWLPLADSILRMVVKAMPSPIMAQKTRLSTLVHKPNADGADMNKFNPILRSIDVINSSIEDCRSNIDDPLVIFVAKMIPVRIAELSARDVQLLNRIRQEKNQSRNEENKDNISLPNYSPDDEVFMALARVYSGVISRNSSLMVLNHRFDPTNLNAEQINANFDSNQNHIPAKFESLVKYVASDSIGMYIMFGPSIFPVEDVPAGNIVGIIGLEDYVQKTATISNTWMCYPMRAITFQAKPMVKVAVETKSHKDLIKLESGLQSLYQFDPVVEVDVDSSGQHTMTCLGELHLEQCVKALTERFAKCEIIVSEPIISFRETTVVSDKPFEPVLPPPWNEMIEMKRTTPFKSRLIVKGGLDNLSISFRCFPIPLEIVQLVSKENNNNFIVDIDESISKYQRQIIQESLGETFSDHISNDLFELEHQIESVLLKIIQDRNAIDSAFLASSNDATRGRNILHRLIAVGPNQLNCNMLIMSNNIHIEVYKTKVPSNPDVKLKSDNHIRTNNTKQNNSQMREEDINMDNDFELTSTEANEKPPVQLSTILSSQKKEFYEVWSRIHSSVVAGFQVAVSSGPLMQEPLYGVGFEIENIEINDGIYNSCVTNACLDNNAENQKITNNNHVNIELTDMELSIGSSVIMTGHLISDVKDALMLSFLSSPMRIIEPIYKCDLQCDQSQLGNLYAVVSKRRGIVTNEDIIEGTSLFILAIQLPIVNSFGFASELLKKTSGSGTTPQLSFSHWQLIDNDPFWRPTTAEELEEFGLEVAIGSIEPNLSRVLIDKVRKRKGLIIEEKIVVSAEKQRTLNKKK
eukprot:gene4266-6045_t